MSANGENLDRKPVDRFIPWMFVLFFAVFMILDAIFVYLAVSTHTGVVTDKAYEKGLAYDSVLEKAAAQKEAGVAFDVSYHDHLFKTSVTDGEGKPIEGASVKVLFIRAVQAGHDFTAALTPSGPGVYSAEVKPPFPGAWTVKVEVQWNDQTYLTTRRVQSE